MKFYKILSLTFTLLLIIANNQLIAQWGWIQQNSGTNLRLNSVHFLNQYTGWTTGDSGVILKTTSGGANWFNQLSGTNVNLYSISFIDFNTGWVGGVCFILKTTNGGINWNISYQDQFTNFTTIYFVNQNFGWAAGLRMSNPNYWGMIFRTTDGGSSWPNPWESFTDNYSSLLFINNLTGWVVGNGRILKTVNGGIVWSYQNSGNYELFSCDFSDEYHGWAVGNNDSGLVLNTTNSGQNWSVQYAGNFPKLNSVKFTYQNIGWAVGDSGTILKTINGGENWLIQQCGKNKNLYSVFIINPNLGWIVGDSGMVLKTTNGGEPIGVKPILSEIPNKFELFQNYPNPFNPTTMIDYQIGRTINVKLIVYDLLSREVATLVNEKQQPGKYQVTWDARNFASGVYFYKLIAGDFTDTKRMVVIK